MVDAAGLIVLIGVQTGGVTDPTHSNQFFCFADCIFKIFRPVHGQRRGQFLVSERFGLVRVRHFADQHLGAGWHGNTGHFCNFGRRLADDGGVERAVFQDNRLYRAERFALKQVAAVGREAFANGIIDFIDHNHRLLGSTDNAVVEGFGHQNRCHGAFDVGGFIDHHRSVARAYADRRFTGAVGRFYHAWAARCQNQVDIWVMHQLIGQFHRRFINPADDVFGCARGDSGLQYDVRRFVGGIFRAWMRREDNTVAGFQADQCFEDSRGGRVGGRNDTADQADRFGNRDGAERIIDGQYAAGLFILVSVIDVLGSEVVLDHFVFNDTHAGFGDRHFRQRYTGIRGSQRGGAEDLIDLLLREICELLLRFFDAFDQSVKFSNVCYGHNALL